MNVAEMMAAIDQEIARLQQAKELLTAQGAAASKRARKAEVQPVKAKRVLSPEARARIADAQKRRWAAAKRAGK